MMLTAKDLSYSYAKGTPVLNELQIDVSPGEVLGLVGPNGSGKSTLIKLIADLLAMQTGDMQIAGYPAGSAEAKTASLYLASNEFLPEFLTGLEYIRLIHRLYGVAFDANILDEWFERYQMHGRQTDLIEDYSHGMRKKVQIIAALMVRRDLTLIDETLNGIDLDASYAFEQDLARHVEHGSAVLLCSHDFTLLERVSARILLLHRGVIVENSSTETLLDRYGSIDKMIRLHLEGVVE